MHEWGRPRLAAVIALALSVFALVACGNSNDGGDGKGSGATSATRTGAVDGITEPVKLKPFEPGPAGEKPDLPKRVAWAMDNDREYTQSVTKGLEAAAKDNGLDVITANANGDSAKNVQQIEQFMAQGIGALVVIPIDPAAQAPVMKEALDKGISVQSIISPPATTQVNTDQYAVGKLIADAAARYIRDELSGNANVVILNRDSIEAARPRIQAMRDVLKTVPGAKIVADVEPESIDKDGAFKTMSTVLQKNPKVDVVLGIADAVVLGAQAALEAAHKDSPRQFLGGVDGEPEALAAIRKGGPYKATAALAPSISGYAMGQNAADWLAGKPIPQGIYVKTTLLDSAAAIDAFEADQRDPAGVYKDEARRAKYLTMFGSISYATRGNYLAFPWAP